MGGAGPIRSARPMAGPGPTAQAASTAGAGPMAGGRRTSPDGLVPRGQTPRSGGSPRPASFVPGTGPSYSAGSFSAAESSREVEAAPTFGPSREAGAVPAGESEGTAAPMMSLRAALPPARGSRSRGGDGTAEGRAFPGESGERGGGSSMASRGVLGDSNDAGEAPAVDFAAGAFAPPMRQSRSASAREAAARNRNSDPRRDRDGVMRNQNGVRGNRDAVARNFGDARGNHEAAPTENGDQGRNAAPAGERPSRFRDPAAKAPEPIVPGPRNSRHLWPTMNTADSEPHQPAGTAEALEGRKTTPTDVRPIDLSAATKAEPAQDSGIVEIPVLGFAASDDMDWLADQDLHAAHQPGGRFRMDDSFGGEGRTSRRYGDRVEGWVRPEYRDEPAIGSSWSPAPDSGYGWPVPVERLPEVPPADVPGYDSEPTAVVPQWPLISPDNRSTIGIGNPEQPRAWPPMNASAAELLQSPSAPTAEESGSRASRRAAGRRDHETRRAVTPELRQAVTADPREARRERPASASEIAALPVRQRGKRPETPVYAGREESVEGPIWTVPDLPDAVLPDLTWAPENGVRSDRRQAVDASTETFAPVDQEGGRSRPRPRPRPGAGSDPADARSTVYVSRHAAEPRQPSEAQPTRQPRSRE